MFSQQIIIKPTFLQFLQLSYFVIQTQKITFQQYPKFTGLGLIAADTLNGTLPHDP